MTVVVAAVLVVVAVLCWPAQSIVDPAALLPDRTESRAGDGEAPAPTGSGGSRLLRRLHRQKPGRDLDAVLALLDSLAPALRAGLAPAAALRCLEVPASRRSLVGLLLVELLEAAEAGEPLAPVWSGRARQTASAELTLVGRAWALSETLGAPLADCVSLAASLVRQRLTRERRLAIALAGPRATTTVLSLLPVTGPGVAMLLGISPVDLYSSPPAIASVGLGVLFLLAGRWWCSRMVSGLTRPRPAHDVGAGS